MHVTMCYGKSAYSRTGFGKMRDRETEIKSEFLKKRNSAELQRQTERITRSVYR